MLILVLGVGLRSANVEFLVKFTYFLCSLMYVQLIGFTVNLCECVLFLFFFFFGGGGGVLCLGCDI